MRKPPLPGTVPAKFDALCRVLNGKQPDRFYVDPNDYKLALTKLASHHTGRELRIGGIDLSFFPTLGLEVSGVRHGSFCWTPVPR